MKLLIPLNRYRVDYELGSGQPFSAVEVLVLQAIAAGVAVSIESLGHLFLLPKRLLIEVLVGLARAGWVALSTEPGIELVVTDLGRDALSDKGTPKGLCISKETDFVLMECLEGNLASSKEITFKTQQDLRKERVWDTAIKLPRARIEPSIDAGRIQHLLRCGRSEWVRWINPPELILQPWLVVEVQTDTGQVLGFPHRWRTHLIERLFAETQAKQREGVRSEQQYPLPPADLKFALPTSTLTDRAVESALSREAILTSNADHWNEIEQALKHAQSSILLASAFLDKTVLSERFKDMLLACARRGVTIDLFWGYSAGRTPQDTQQAIQLLKGLARDAALQGKINFNEKPTGSHVKVLIWDSPDGFQATVGSYNWLSVDPALGKDDNTVLKNVSIRLRHPSSVANICRSLAAIWSHNDPYNLLDVPVRWQNIAASLEKRAVFSVTDQLSPATGDITSPSSFVSIIRDQEHEGVMRELILSSHRRCGIVSHRVGAKASIRLASLKAKRDIEEYQISVTYGHFSSTSDDVGESGSDPVWLAKEIDHPEVRVRYCKGIHSKILVCDDQILISSYNFLSADPFDSTSNSREIGILVLSKDLADFLWEKMSAL